MTPAVRVVSPGIATSVRAAGRRGLAHLGVPRGGAVDLAALGVGNRLVGNEDHAAAVETSGALTIETSSSIVVAVTGSPVDLEVSEGPPFGWGVATTLTAGARLTVGRLRGGARAYVCVRGGLDPGERPAAAPDDRWTIGPEPARPVSAHVAVPAPLDAPVRIWPGPRRDWFTADAWTTLLTAEWTVRPESDRTGTRLDGPTLGRHHHGELPSEGLVEGAIQVPTDGRPIVMLADHPTTGGYPVIAVVDPDDVPLVAQRPPGAALRFVRTGSAR